MFTPHPRQRSAEDRLIAAGSLLLGGGKAGGLSRRNRYCDIPSMTVGVLLEMLRPVPVLIRNPNCEGGDILTIWRRFWRGNARVCPHAYAWRLKYRGETAMM